MNIPIENHFSFNSTLFKIAADDTQSVEGKNTLKEIAEWLNVKLKDQGLQVEGVEKRKYYYCISLSVDERTVFLFIDIEPDSTNRWQVQICVDSQSILKKLFGNNSSDTEVSNKIKNSLLKLINENSQTMSDIEWWNP